MSIDLLPHVDIKDIGERVASRPPASTQGLFGRLGTLETRLARNDAEIAAAQRLRFTVFVEEMGAQLPPEAMQERRDYDAYDTICDHLLVTDSAIEGDPEDQIVGTYRLLRQDVAERHSGFYSAHEFDIGPLMA